MVRTSMLALLIFGFTSFAASGEEAKQLACTGMMIEPTAMSQSPETVVLTLEPAQKITVDLGKGAVNARKVSDNKIQLKFRTKDFEGEYFPLQRRSVLHLQIWASNEADMSEARKCRLGPLWRTGPVEIACSTAFSSFSGFLTISY